MDIKPRVLFIVRFLWGHEGISVGLARLAKGLIEQGWEVALASAMTEEGDANRDILRGSKWFESQGIKHFFVPFPQFRLSPGTMIQAYQAIRQLDTVVRQFKPDVINIHSLSMCPYAQVMRLIYEIPFVSTARVEPNIDHFSVKLGAFVNQYFSQLLGDRFIAISTEVKNIYQHKLKVPKENIRLVCHGVEHEDFRPPSPQERREARQALGLVDAKVISLIGRLDPIKGHDVLFQALSLLQAAGTEAIALCAGEGGNWKASIQASAAEMGVADCVRFLGFADARQVLWASDVLTLPSRREGFAWVIAEAMLCGVVPVRTPAAGAIDQIEDGVNGFIIPFNDPQALATRLKQLLENDELRQKMAEAAIKSARQKFTADKMTKNTIAVYQEVMLRQAV